jgi:hypothetical protein
MFSILIAAFTWAAGHVRSQSLGFGFGGPRPTMMSTMSTP